MTKATEPRVAASMHPLLDNTFCERISTRITRLPDVYLAALTTDIPGGPELRAKIMADIARSMVIATLNDMALLCDKKAAVWGRFNEEREYAAKSCAAAIMRIEDNLRGESK